jgi:protein-S-isoprenylcysteine O-methyltransferase Ste14
VHKSAPPRSLRAAWEVVKTLGGIVLLWAVFLIVLPLGVSVIEVRLGIQRFPGLAVLATIAMPIFALLGLWAAMTLAIEAAASALRGDTGDRLVVSGPYAYVRNPLMISAMGHGAAIALAFGSLMVSLYMVICAVLWHGFWRPLEEQRQRERHGARWERYMREVKSLRPRLRPYGTKN